MPNKKRINADEEGDTSACKVTPSVAEKCCVVCGVGAEMKRCGKCKLVMYCSKECQKAHLSHHTDYCSMIHDLKEIETKKIYNNRTVRQATCSVKVRKKLLKLVGEKPVVRCRLDRKEVDMLWDTGSMISVVDRKWLNRMFPGAIIHSVSDFTDKELHVQAANSTKIRFDGVVVLGFALGE